MEVTIIKPTEIALLVTTRCTSACKNCCFGCNPKQGRTMTYDEMKKYIDMSLEAYPDTISTLGLTGGECMLLGKDVDKIFRYAKSKGLICCMVSNAFWATDYDKAFKTLKRLKRNGLRKADFSTGNDHNQYVPWQNVRHAAVAAAHLGIEVCLRIEYSFCYLDINNAIHSDEEVNDLIQKGKLRLSIDTWMQFINRGKRPRNYKIRFPKHRKTEKCLSLFQNIIINPYGEVYACCGLGMCKIPQMRLGNINQEPIKTIYERAFQDFLKIWLFTEGPNAVLKYVFEKTGQKFNWHTNHHCDICRIIFTDKTILPIIKENFYDIAETPLSFYNTIAQAINEARTKQR